MCFGRRRERLDQLGTQPEIVMQSQKGDALEAHHNDLNGTNHGVGMVFVQFLERFDGQPHDGRFFGSTGGHSFEDARMSRQIVGETQQRADRFASFHFFQRHCCAFAVGRVDTHTATLDDVDIRVRFTYVIKCSKITSFRAYFHSVVYMIQLLTKFKFTNHE